MPITTRFDAAAVVPPSNQSTRKYGQALVLQQRKYDQDTVMRAHDRFYDAQRQRANQEFQLDLADVDRATREGIAKGQQDFSAAQQQKVLDAQAARDQQQNQQRAAEAEQKNAMIEEGNKKQAIENARRQKKSLIMDSLDNNEFLDPKAVRDNLMAEATIDADETLTDEQRKIAHSKNYARRDQLWESRIQRTPKKSGTPTFEEHIQSDPDKAQKALAAKMGELSDQSEITGKKYTNEDDLRAAAIESMRGNYNALFGGGSAAQGQAPAAQAAPSGVPAQSPTAQAAAAPTAAATEPVAQQPIAPTAPSWPKSQWAMDGIVQQQPTAPVEITSNVEPTYKPDGTTSQDTVYGQMQDQIRMKDAQAEAARRSAEDSMYGPGAPLAMDEEVTPDVVPPEEMPSATAPKTAATAVPATDFNAVANGTPEEKRAARKSIEPDMMDSLQKAVASGDPEAIKQLDALEKMMDKQDEYESSVRALRDVDPSKKQQHIKLLKGQLKEGAIKPIELIGRITAAEQVTPSQLYESLMKNPPSRSASPGRRTKEKITALTGLLDEMGTPSDSMLSVPSEDDVINKVAKIGSMSRADAKEYVYKEILARQYSGDILDRLSASLPEQVKKQQSDKKRKNWTPSKDY